MFSPVKVSGPFPKGRGSLLKPISPHSPGACDCPAHRSQPPLTNGSRASGWAALLPIAACALCPACLSAWAPLLATLGVGLAFTESEHAALLIAAIALSLIISIRRALRNGVWAPVWLTLLGGGAMLGAHLLNDNAALTGVGVVCFLSAAASSIWRSRTKALALQPNLGGKLEA